jgi:hypothetical protein
MRAICFGLALGLATVGVAPAAGNLSPKARDLIQGRWAMVERVEYEVVLGEDGVPGLKKTASVTYKDREGLRYTFEEDKVSIVMPGTFGEIGSSGDFRLGKTANGKTLTMKLTPFFPRGDCEPENTITTVVPYSLELDMLTLVYKTDSGHSVVRLKRIEK